MTERKKKPLWKGLALLVLVVVCLTVGRYLAANYLLRGDGGPDAPASHLSSGRRHLREGQLDSAISEFTQAIRLAPRSADAHAGRADAWREKEEWENAIADYLQALSLGRKDADTRAGLGRCRAEKGELDQAIGDLTEALRLSPKHGRALLWRGMVYSRKRDLDRAMADYTAVIENEDLLILDLERLRSAAYCNRGAAYASKHDADRAIADATAAIALHPKSAIAHANRGVAHGLLKHDRSKALADLERAVALGHPDAEKLRALIGELK
jgi:tetratricopeptide (TPR) repeat protein